jgi:hypothetical protein
MTTIEEVIVSSPDAGQFSTVLVEDRAWTRRVPELDLWCDDREVPVNLTDTYDNWLGGVYMRQSPPPSDGEAAELTARVALAVGEGRLVGIISPYEARQPAIWFSIALDDLLMIRVTRHRYTRRLRMITVYVQGWALVLVAIARHDGSMEWRGHERSLLKASGGPTSWRKRWAVVQSLYGRR